jgi:hypothetical protein
LLTTPARGRKQNPPLAVAVGEWSFASGGGGEFDFDRAGPNAGRNVDEIGRNADGVDRIMVMVPT